MPPSWLVRSLSQRGDDLEVGGSGVNKEAIEAFQEFFDAEDLNNIMDAFNRLCQMLNLVPGYH